MEKVAAFIANKYYTDAGMEYVFSRMREELNARGVLLRRADGAIASFPFTPPACDFVLFWNKDTALARALENAGVRVFNSAAAIETCDDKEKTFAAVTGKVVLPQTVIAPLVYDVSDGADQAFLEHVAKTVGFPAVVKACVGSQGRQVFLAKDENELRALHEKMMHTPHLFQRFVRGERAGTDTRVYIVGGRAVGAVERRNTTDFRSGVAVGGQMFAAALPLALQAQAERAAAAIGLSYGSVDFMCEEGTFVFIEANSSAYMQNAERLGIPLAERYAAYLMERVYG
ncbi:MAG: hypothetical protein HFE46_05620 [Clostridia bacterium]|nr:hypothetical protein [Clostridia bacterium]